MRPLLLAAFMSLSSATALVAVTPAAHAQEVTPVRISVDRAKVVRIPRAADTVIIGNPGIVDATLQDATTIVLTGRTVGETNVIVLDEAGDPIGDETIVVGQARHTMVRVFTGTLRLSYACAPNCTRAVDAGDEPKPTEDLLKVLSQKHVFSAGKQ